MRRAATKSAHTLAEVAAIDHMGGIHMRGLVEERDMVAVEESMIATKRRLPTDLHPPERAQGQFPLGLGFSIVKMRLFSQPERKLLRGPEGLHMIRFEIRSNAERTYMKPRIRHLPLATRAE